MSTWTEPSAPTSVGAAPDPLRSGLAAKRLMDILAAALGLAVFTPVLGLTALVIVSGSSGPALFRQVRVGRDGKTFTLLKLRTMRDGGGTTGMAEGDGRVTPVGAILRQTKFDELPQLYNVLVGEMSLVGPRPELPFYVSLYSEQDRRAVLSVRPGLTDFASLRFMSEAKLLGAQGDPELYYRNRVMPQKLRLCRFYVRRRSLAVDLFLIFETIRSILHGSGRVRRAYPTATGG